MEAAPPLKERSGTFWSAAVFRIEPAKVLAFAKEPHGQTTYRLADD